MIDIYSKEYQSRYDELYREYKRFSTEELEQRRVIASEGLEEFKRKQRFDKKKHNVWKMKMEIEQNEMDMTSFHHSLKDKKDLINTNQQLAQEIKSLEAAIKEDQHENIELTAKLNVFNDLINQKIGVEEKSYNRSQSFGDPFNYKNTPSNFARLINDVYNMKEKLVDIEEVTSDDMRFVQDLLYKYRDVTVAHPYELAKIMISDFRGEKINSYKTDEGFNRLKNLIRSKQIGNFYLHLWYSS